MATKPLRIPNSTKRKKDENKATFTNEQLKQAQKEFLQKDKLSSS